MLEAFAALVKASFLLDGTNRTERTYTPPSFGVVVGGDGGTACALEKPRGKSACGLLTREFQQNDNTALKNYDCDENDCAPFAPGSPTRPTGVRARFQSEAAAGVPLRRRVPKRQAPVWPLRAGVATMRARNTMRFSAPTREPPGGRPSRGAKQKWRGCTRQKDAAARRSA